MGFVLDYIFGYQSALFTAGLLLFMMLNASYNAAKRGKGIKHSAVISFVAILSGILITLAVLLLLGFLDLFPTKSFQWEG